MRIEDTKGFGRNVHGFSITGDVPGEIEHVKARV